MLEVIETVLKIHINTQKDYVDVWEIGNEVNGEEWIKESPKFTAKKFIQPINLLKVKMALLL